MNMNPYYPPGFQQLEDTIEDPCPQFGEELKLRYWWKRGDSLDPTDPLECENNHTIIVKEYVEDKKKKPSKRFQTFHT